MVKLEIAIQSLADNDVEFVIVGEIACFIYGWKTITTKFEINYSEKDENLTKIVSALSRFNPRPRDFPNDLPYFFDERSLQNATNFTFETTIGDIDLLGEVAGVGTYSEVKKSSVIFELYERDVQVLSIDALIDAKRAAGRTKDLLVLPELEALREALSDEEE